MQPIVDPQIQQYSGGRENLNKNENRLVILHIGAIVIIVVLLSASRQNWIRLALKLVYVHHRVPATGREFCQ